MWWGISAAGLASILAAVAYSLIELWRRTPEGKLDPLLAVALVLIRARRQPPRKPATEMRADFDKVVARFHGRPPRMKDLRDEVVHAGSRGIPIRLYLPEGERPMPVVLYFHGGGFVLGSLSSHDNICRHIASAAQSLVIATDYRLAPENPFPAAIEDSYSVLQWAAVNASALGGDGRDITVAGDSAGGTISAVLCLMARDRGGPRIARQVLVYPSTDISSMHRPSYEMYGKGYLLDSKQIEWFTDQYLPDPSDRLNPYTSPLLAESLEGLPPALLITARFDALRDEAAAYAERLKRSGVEAAYECVPGVGHGFLSLTGVMRRRTRDSIREIADFIRAGR